METETYQPSQQLPHVLCCNCGVPILPNAVNTCAACLASTADITRGISTQATLHQCRGCQRWHQSSGKWIALDLESRELMALCLSNVSGLKSSGGGGSGKKSNDGIKAPRLVDAAWIWTEPHSMRLKVRLTVQREVQTGTVLQQSFVVEFVVRNQQCTDCQAVFRQGSWKSLVQVRQRVSHKRTFLYLEQLILKHGAHRGCLNIKTFKDGMDFYFPDKGKAARFISFLENVVPIRTQSSKKLISTDCKSNIANFKYTNIVEICPLCKDDLLYLPAKLARSLGNISRLVLVKNVSNLIHLQDPLSGQTAGLTCDAYWRHEAFNGLRPLVPSSSKTRLTRYVVLGREAVVLRPNASQRRTTSKAKSRLARVVVAKEHELGARDTVQIEELSHVGYLLRSGDVCVGYDLRDTQLVDDEAEQMRSEGKLPDVVLVRKLYGGAAAAALAVPETDESGAANAETTTSHMAKRRIWRLQRLDVEVGDEEGGGRQRRGTKSKKDAVGDDVDMDEEEFMQEVEADREMRQTINLFRDAAAVAAAAKKQRAGNSEISVDDDEDDDQKIKLEELLDGLALDAGPDEEDLPDAYTQVGDGGNDDGGRIVEEGTRAHKDGISYVDREAARAVRDKEVAVHVKAMAEDFMSQQTKK
jgi:nonsense-mediated mRNA decay protein 3